MAQGDPSSGDAKPKFSFTWSSKVSSRRRPPLPPKAPSEPVVECVTSVDSEAGVVLANPQAGARVVPKQENSRRPETRMKNIMQEADATRSTDETFDVETMDAGPKPNVVYGLTVMPTRAEGEVVERHISLKEPEDQKLRDDLMNLPEEATLEKYEELPVEEFAEVLFRGMGWEKGKPIGRNATAVIAPIEHAKRPERLGLGAVPAPAKEVNKKFIKPGESTPKPRPDLRALVAANGRPVDVVEQTMERYGKVGERHGRPSLNAEESRGRSSVEDHREDERPSKRSHRHREEEDERYSKRFHRHRDVEDERNSKRDHRHSDVEDERKSKRDHRHSDVEDEQNSRRDHRHSEGEVERYSKRGHRHSKDDDRGERRGSKDRRDRR